MCAAAKENNSPLEKDLERIFSSLGYGMYVVDKDGRIMLWNRAAQSILGWSAEEASGNKCSDFIAHQNDEGEQLCESVCPLKASINEARTTFTGTVWAHGKDGGLVPVNVSCAPLFNGAGDLTGAVEIFLDMTREKELERMREDIITAVTHELKSPLTAIKGYLDLLMEGEAGEITEDQHGFLGIIDENTNKLLELANDYLDLDRLKSDRSVLHWEEVQLGPLVDETARKFAPLVEAKGLSFKTEIDDCPSVPGDPELLKSMLNHLVKNAIQYTIEGRVTISCRTDGKTVSLEVADTGVGIPEGELDRLGERFFRASTASIAGIGGSGLGITITREIVAKHGAYLVIASSPGKGTVCTVTLNISPEKSSP